MKSLPLFLIGLFILGLTACNCGEKNVNNTKATDLTLENDSMASVADSTDLASVRDTTETLIIVPPSDDKTKKTYYLIVGSFQDYTNAKKLDSLLKATGDQPAVMETYNNFTRVAKASFDNKAEAEAAVKKYRAQNPNVEAWLFYK